MNTAIPAKREKVRTAGIVDKVPERKKKIMTLALVPSPQQRAHIYREGLIHQPVGATLL